MKTLNKSGLFIFAIYTQFAAIAQTSFWTASTVPAVIEDSDPTSVTLGLRFYSDVPGSIVGIRFYKGPNNGGTHVGNLWSNTGAKLATVTFSGETPSGWQQALFSTPVNITANTTYVVSYIATGGHYAGDPFYGWGATSAVPLHVSGSSPGVYAVGSTPAFPTNTWNSSNYWVDPMFVASTQAPPSTSPGSAQFWKNSTNPGTPEVTNDTSSVTLGLKFYSDVPGTVSGVRFYKGSRNTGTHLGTLWSNTGTKLSELTFSAETASGWQQANFSSPVSIAANTTYVISYLAPRGSYAVDQNYAWSSVSATPLHVSGTSPGVFAYGSASTFPAGTWNASNYWVDLVFLPSTSTPPPLYSISGAVAGTAATLSLSGPINTSTTTDATGRYTFAGLPDGTYTIAASRAGYNFTPATASIILNRASVTRVNFTATAILHSVTLSWNASTSANIIGYNIYRGSTSGGPYAQVGFVGGTSYLDTSVSGGQTYYYVATAIDGSNTESAFSSQIGAAIPLP